MPRVLIPTKFTRASGGLSTLLDLGQVLEEIGYDVSYYSSRYVSLLWFFRIFVSRKKGCVSYWQLVRIREDVRIGAASLRLAESRPKTKKRFVPHFGIFKALKNLPAREVSKALLFWVWEPFEILLGLVRGDRKKIKEAAAVVVFDLRPEVVSHLVTEFRRKSNATLVWNHAGSAKLFIHGFITKANGSRCDVESSLSTYVDLLGSFDCALFQSSDQLEASAKIAKLRSEDCALLRPSCDEGAALAAKTNPNPFANRDKSIVVIAPLHPRKAQDLAIRAFQFVLAEEPSAQLHLVGAVGNEHLGFEQQIKRLVHSLDLESHVHFHGHKSDYLDWIAHSDLVIQPSRSEGVSRILRETIFLRKNLVAFDIPGTQEILGGSKSNLATPYDVVELGKKAVELLSEADQAKELTDFHFQRYMTTYSWTAYRSSAESVFRELVNRNS